MDDEFKDSLGGREKGKGRMRERVSTEGRRRGKEGRVGEKKGERGYIIANKIKPRFGLSTVSSLFPSPQMLTHP